MWRSVPCYTAIDAACISNARAASGRHWPRLMFLYNLLLTLALPWMWGRLWWKARAEPEYAARMPERFGILPSHLPKNAIWFHCVSAGETIGAAPMVRELRRRLPNVPIVVTTMTPAGAARARALLGDAVAHCRAPYDFPWAVDRCLKHLRPRALVLVETELWPNLVVRAAAAAPVFLINARLSARSHARYALVPRLMRRVLGGLEAVLCQYEDSAERFRDLGLPADRAQVTGSVKFDIDLPPVVAGDAGVWIAGSTHPPEEEVVLDAHERLRARFPHLRLLLVPRHVTRAPAVLRMATRRGLSAGLQSAGGEEAVDVVVGDVMGTLAGLYGQADVAFLGGSLDDTGGHNPIEAAVHGRPMVMGPERRNFEEVCRRFEEADCLHLARDAGELADAIGARIADPQRRQREGAAARQVVMENAGATRRTVDSLVRCLEGCE